MPKSQRAFALLEILIIIAIIGVIAFGGFYFSRKNSNRKQGEIKVPQNSAEQIKALNRAKKDIDKINKNIEKLNSKY